MKLILDEMHSHIVGTALNERGHDVVAVVLEPELRGLADPNLLAHASSTGRALVTENVGDFMRLHRAWTVERRTHAGLVLTHPRTYHRASRAYPGDLITALDHLLRGPVPDGDSWIHWL